MKKTILKAAAAFCSAVLLLAALPLSALGAAGDYSGELYGKDKNSALHDGSSSTSFGWADDLDAPIAYPDGSYLLRDRGDWLISFGFQPEGRVEWSLAGGYYPCVVSRFTSGAFTVKIESFADLLELDGNRYEVAYTRVTAMNNIDGAAPLPAVSSQLIPLNNSARYATTADLGATVIREYCVGADRFGGTYDYPADEVLAAAGSFDEHYDHMTAFWDSKLDGIVQITALPDGYADLIDAYKAGYIYQLIVGDCGQLNVGENGYDIIYYADLVEMLAVLVTLGDTDSFRYYAGAIVDSDGIGSSPNGRMKSSWPFALYLKETGDTAYILEHYSQLRKLTYGIVQSMIRYEDYTLADGKPVKILAQTGSTDADGYWLADNWIALFGLTTFGYICEYLENATGDDSYEADLEWVKEAYDDLLHGVDFVLNLLYEKTGITYLPMDLLCVNEESTHADPRDANWGVAMMTGRWAWDGYLFGADQDSPMIDRIDQTYDWCFSRRESVTDSPYNAGGFPGYFYSSAYNAGYGSTALLGEKYRTWGIEAYRFMIDHTMAGPYAWFESMSAPDGEKAETTLSDMVNGNGSSPHLWGQAVATKMLLDALVAERVDGGAAGSTTVLIGRGIPDSWITSGQPISLKNYALAGGKTIGFTLRGGEEITLTLDTDSPSAVSLELPILVGSIAAATDESGNALSFDREKGTVAIPAGVRSVTVKTGSAQPDDSTTPDDSTAPVTQSTTAPKDGLPGGILVWILSGALICAVAAAAIVIAVRRRKH